MIRKKIAHTFEFRLMKKKKGAHLKRPQVHFGDCFDKPSDYWSLSDTRAIELRDWLSQYINRYIEKKPAAEILQQTRINANLILKNANKLESEI